MSAVTYASPEAYWSSFELESGDIDFIINLLLEREIPLTTVEMALALVEVRLVQIKLALEEAKRTEYPAYLPADSYKVGQVLTFPIFNNLIGEVVGVREGNNPDIGTFGVIEVKFQNGDPAREFAMNFPIIF